MNQTKPDLQVIFNNNETCPQFAGGYNTTDEFGNLVMVDNCECERRKVISDPTTGFGEFNIRSGLFLDEQLQVPLPVDQDVIIGVDRLFVGLELMEVTNPTMVVIVEQLWATKTGDLNDPNPMMLVDNQENCAILHPDVTEVPEANPFDANREFLKFPYIAYELDPEMFDS